MITFLGINYNCEEVPIQNVDNVFSSEEFQIQLPTGIELVSMPKMMWTRVRVETINHSFLFNFISIWYLN